MAADAMSGGLKGAFSGEGHRQLVQVAFWTRGFGRSQEAVIRREEFIHKHARLLELEQDYGNMREMIFGEPPTFEPLLDLSREIERKVNG